MMWLAILQSDVPVRATLPSIFLLNIALTICTPLGEMYSSFCALPPLRHKRRSRILTGALASMPLGSDRHFRPGLVVQQPQQAVDHQTLLFSIQ